VQKKSYALHLHAYLLAGVLIGNHNHLLTVLSVLLLLRSGTGLESADVGGESLLHNLLNHPFPLAIRPNSDTPAELAAALAAAPPGRNPAAGSVTLNELLARKPKPNVEDAAGNTALHMLVACMVQRVHFPDPKLPGKQHGLQEDEEETIVEGSGSTMHQQQQQQQQEKQQQDKQQQDGEQEPQRLEDNDAARAAYGQLAFRMLLEAGWEPGWRNHNGYTVSNLIEAGLARYQTGAAAWGV
jgi:hypothetical protein